MGHTNFIQDLKNKSKEGQTLLALAPMADVTDQVFRRLIAKYSRPAGPDIFWTEFVSADGLASPGKEALLIDFVYSQKEYPILAQIFSSKKENILQAINLVHKLGFAGVDINMGCPDKSIEKQISGSAMIKYPELAREILESVKELVDEINTKQKTYFSFSVKTRLGYNSIEYETWFPNILDFEPDIFSLHLRTRKELSLVPAHWEMAREVVEFIKNYCEEHNLKTPLIFLNGDVKSVREAKIKAKMSGADGIMLGRGVFGTPWIFNEQEFNKRREQNLETKEGKRNILFRLKVLKRHTKLYEKKLLKYKSFNIMKKHYKAYVNGFEGAKELRIKLMETKDYRQVKSLAKDFIKNKLK